MIVECSFVSNRLYSKLAYRGFSLRLLYHVRSLRSTLEGKHIDKMISNFVYPKIIFVFANKYEFDIYFQYHRSENIMNDKKATVDIAQEIEIGKTNYS